MQESFLPLLREAGVDLILCGHQHVYMRAEDAGLTQVMLASGGKQYQPAAAAWPDYAQVAIEDEPAYLLCRVTAAGLYCRVFGADGADRPLDEFTISAATAATEDKNDEN